MSIQSDLTRTFNRAIESALNEMETIGREWTSYNARVVSNWAGKPGFVYRVVASRRLVYDLEIEPTGDNANKWIWTDRGTEPHKIRARNVANLVFRTGHNPKTRAIARFGVGDGSSSGRLVKKREVDHPGTEARKFTETYASDNEQQIRQRIAARISRELMR